MSAQEFTYYDFSGALPDGLCFVLDKRLGTLTLLAAPDANEHPILVKQEQFSRSELSVIVPILDNYPRHCPHEQVYASYYGGEITDATLARAHARLEEAEFAGPDAWENEMRPVRNVLSRARPKLRLLGMQAHAVLDTGYMLLFLATPTPPPTE